VKILIISILILLIAITMAMVGRGGGNFYVPLLVGAGLPMRQSATTAQLILFVTAIAATMIFHKRKTVDWMLALVIDPPTDIMAFVGGYYAHKFSGPTLKLIFAGLLVIAGLAMLLPKPSDRLINGKKRFGFWERKYGDYNYTVNLWLAIPITAFVGFAAGMVGISGGSFKIPLMVLACGVPMRIAVGTSSVMVAVTAICGFFGHAVKGDFNPAWAIPACVVALIGGIIGGFFSLKTKPENLKKIFAFTTIAAAVFMAVNAFLSVS